MSRVHSRLIVELDDLASAYVRLHMAGDSILDVSRDDPRDVASAAVAFLFQNPDADDSTSEQVLRFARERRLNTEGRRVSQRTPAVQITLDDHAAGLLALFVDREARANDARDVVNGFMAALLCFSLHGIPMKLAESVQAAAKRQRAAARKEEA